MNSRQILIITLVHFGVALAVITAATVLAALHDIDASAVTALYGAAIGLVGGTGASLAQFYRNGNTTPTTPAA